MSHRNYSPAKFNRPRSSAVHASSALLAGGYRAATSAIVFATLITSTFLPGCKDTESARQIEELQAENRALREQVESLSATDQAIFGEATDLMNAGQFDTAIDKFSQLKERFPTSPLLPVADEKIAEATRKLAEQYDQEFVHQTGVQVIEYNTEWAFAGGLLQPLLSLKLQNASTSDLTNLVVKASFFDPSRNEVVGDDSALLVGYSDIPLRPGFSKLARLRPGVGYPDDTAALSLPAIQADVYINDAFYKRIPIRKRYAGVDW